MEVWESDMVAALKRERDELLEKVTQLEEVVAGELAYRHTVEAQVVELSAQANQLEREAGAAQDENQRLLALLDGVLFEAGLQAHSVGCAQRLTRTRVSRGTEGPCRGCAAEAALRGGGE